VAEQTLNAGGWIMTRLRAQYHRILIVLLLCTLPASAAYSQELISVSPERLAFPASESSAAGRTVVAGFMRGYGKYAVTWRLGTDEAVMRLTAGSDGMFHYDMRSNGYVVTPSGDRLAEKDAYKPHVSGILALPSEATVTDNGLSYASGDIRWRYTVAAGRTLLRETLQQDAQGNIFFHDDTGAYYGVDERGQAVLQLYIEDSGGSLQCRVTPAGDIGCSHPDIGLFGLRGYSAAELRIFVDGKEQYPSSRPFVKEGTTFLPFRYLAEAMRASVAWNDETREVEMRWGSRSIAFASAGSSARIDGKQVPLEPAVIERNGAVYVPIRFFAEALGAMVIWEGKTRSIQIVTRER
jgi:hypothetical protein